MSLFYANGQNNEGDGLSGNQWEYRGPQYPLMTESRIYSDKDVLFARQKTQGDENAKRIADDIIEAAEKWIDWNDEDLMKLIPDGRVPRSFDLSVNGCPVHGDKVFQLSGRYSWILDPKKLLRSSVQWGMKLTLRIILNPTMKEIFKTLLMKIQSIQMKDGVGKDLMVKDIGL